MLTKELVKGQRVRLRNGWEAVLTRKPGSVIAEARVFVFGYVTEVGSVYCHDIIHAQAQDGFGAWVRVRHTPAQLRCRRAHEFAFGP